jgi:hypothetical protein
VGVWGARKFFSSLLLSFFFFLFERVGLTDNHRWYPKDITVYYMPGTIGISHNNDGTVPDVITLKIENKDDGADSGMCEILTGIGGAVAGAVNGVAGGIFSLGSLACGAI